MPPEVGDGLYHLLQWDGAQAIEEGKRAEQEQREREELERLRKMSFGDQR